MTCYSHIKWNTGSRSTTSSHIAQSAMAPEAMNQDTIGSKGGCQAKARNKKIMKARSLTRVPSYRHRGSPPRHRSPRGLLRRRCRRGSALLHPLHVTHRVCLLGDSIEEKGRKSDRTGKEIRCRVKALRRSTAPPIQGPPVQVDKLGLVGAATTHVRRLRRSAYRFRRKAALRQPGQGRGKPEGAPLRLPPEDATGAKAAHRPRPWWVRRPRCRPAATTTRPGRAAAVGSAHGRARRWSPCSRI